jgi:hypothetical protein
VSILLMLVGVFVTVRGIRARDRVELGIGAILVFPILLLWFPFTSNVAIRFSYYMTARLGLMLKFAPFFAVAWIVGEALRTREVPEGVVNRMAVPRGAAVLLGITILVSHAFVSWPLTQVTFVRMDGQMRNGEAYTVFESREADIRDAWGLSALWDARAAFADDYPIVAASPETGYYLAGLADCAIVAAPPSHSPLAVETVDGPERREDMLALLDPAASVVTRAEILDRRDAEFVALSPGSGVDSLTWESMQQQPELFEPVVVTRRFVLVRVLR